MKKLLVIILVVSISLWCLLGALEWNAFNIDFYMNSYEKYNVQEITGKDKNELKSITEDFFVYLRGDAGNEILEPNFNEREILHMEDVQVLFKIGFRLKYIAIFLTGLSIAILWKRKEKNFVKHTVIGLFLNWIILSVLFLMIYFDFSKYFTLFHHIFFSNDLWMLNPRTDLLIQMLPEELFMAIATRTVILFISFIGIIQLIGYIMTIRGKDRNIKKQTN